MSDPVLIGVLSTKVSGDAHCNDNVIGGVPLVPGGWQKPKCESCGKEMTFLLRIDAPVGVSIVSRLLYMFICCRRSCLETAPSQCFTLLRYQVMKQKSCVLDNGGSAIDLTEWQFEGADDWGGDYDFEEEDKAAVKTCPPNPSTSEESPTVTDVSFQILDSASGDDNVTFSGHYIDVFQDSHVDEKEESRTLTSHERELLEEYYGADDVDKHVEDLYCEAVVDSVSDKEEAGEDEEDLNSKLLTRFVQRLSSYPSQVIRYQWAGSPLLAEALPAAPDDAHNRCRHCGGRTVFEFQITPGLFAQVTCDEECVDEVMRHVSIATVLVYSCADCCWEGGRLEGKIERCLVQMETVSAELSDDD